MTLSSEQDKKLNEKIYFYASTKGEYCKDTVSINDFNRDNKFRVVVSPEFGSKKALELRFKGYTVAYLFKEREYQIEFLKSKGVLKKSA